MLIYNPTRWRNLELNKQKWARRMAVTANALLTISIFLVTTCWGASLALFSTCGVLYCTVWWMWGGAGELQDSHSDKGLTNRLTLPPVR